MHKIILAGKEMEKYASAFSDKGVEVVFHQSSGDFTNKSDKPDLLIVGQSEQPFADNSSSSRNIPKIVIGSGRKEGFSLWINEPMSYPLHDPTDSELQNFALRILKEKDMLQKLSVYEHEIRLLKNEVTFYEEINRMLTSSVEINDILVVIMQKVQEITMAESWSILMVEEETGDLVFEKTEGKAKKTVKKFRLKPGEGIAGWVAKEGIPVVVEDVQTDTRFSSRIDFETNYNTKTLMCMPIKSKDRILGVLEVINKTNGESFTVADMNILEKFVKQAALALEKSSLYNKMEELVITDDLTKLFNTRYLNRTIETEVIRSNRYHTSLSLIFMDIDHFKQVNDNFGHLIGSKILVEMGQILLNQLRSIDIVARYGGDEFVIVLPQTSPNDGVRIAERIRKAVEQNVFLHKEGYDLKITSSFGVASYPESAKTKEDLLRVADEAMYRVKHSTRNGVFAVI